MASAPSISIANQSSHIGALSDAYARDEDELVAQWLERAFGPAMASAQAVLGGANPPADRLAAWLDSQLDFAAKPRDGAAARLMAEFDHLLERIQACATH